MKTTKTLLLCLLMSFTTAQAQTDYRAQVQEYIESAELYLDTCRIDMYPYGVLEDLRDAIVMARNVIAGNATNSELLNQRTKVRQAISNLRAVFGHTFNTNTEVPVYDANRGFIHPGGLHTQADFDRIKAQLAAGNPKVTEAFNKLKSGEYAQPTARTYPVEIIIRGGGVGENYINAARGATIAYQNGLRWKIEGNEACAANAVKVLMEWVRTCKVVSGDSNYALASGIYGYEFAQAAELVRDYEGWSPEEFQEFCQWMLDVWYRPAMGFLRGRNGTWENGARWWEAPGHYWSNWGLCNALCIMSMGVLLDDVFIYNQGLSFIKHDQCGTFTDPRIEIPIKNDGLTEFWGNLIVTTTYSDLETGAYGQLGQMNESGRDGGHAAMALGLAVDVAHQGYNQGDDLFAFMNHRLAAGIEFTAACTDTLKAGIHRGELPFTEYLVANNGIYYHDGRVGRHTEPALEAHTRNYWGTVIGHYEGVKGVRMPFSEIAYNNMGIDGGGGGSTSGGYDHLGFSVLLNTRDVQIAPANKVPTELSGNIIYKNQTLKYNELGGLNNHYTRNNTVPDVLPGNTARLVPVLPDGEVDTGNWLWDSGETTKELEVTTDRSQVYRVTYTNANGIKSQQCFSIAVQGDCRAQNFNTSIKLGDTVIGTDEATVEYGTQLTLSCEVYEGVDGWCSCVWDNGSTESSITTNPIVRDRDFYVAYINQGGLRTVKRIRIHVNYTHLFTTVNGVEHPDTTVAVVNIGDKVKAGVAAHSSYKSLVCEWNTGETQPSFTIDNIETSYLTTLTYSSPEIQPTSVDFSIFVVDPNGDYELTPGYYIIRHAATGTVLTHTEPKKIMFMEQEDVLPPEQMWLINTSDNPAQYSIQSGLDEQYIGASATPTTSVSLNQYRLEKAVGVDRFALRNRRNRYLTVKDNMLFDYTTQLVLNDYPYELIPVELPTGIEVMNRDEGIKYSDEVVYDLMGRKVADNYDSFIKNSALRKGLYIINGKKTLIP